jgi:hypothetical protein
MQSEHKLALTKNYVLLVNESPVDDILDELRKQQIVSEEQREFITRQPTQKGRTRALLELLPRRGPKARVKVFENPINILTYLMKANCKNVYI